MARRVRTSEGARYYGLPVGTLITPDILERARSRNGGKNPPKGSTTQARAVSKAPQVPKAGFVPPGAKGAPDEGPTKADEIAKGEKHEPRNVPLPRRLSKPSITGSKQIEVGDRTFRVPSGAQVFQPADRSAAFVMVDEELHVFGPGGERDISPELQSQLKSKMVSDPYLQNVDASTDQPKASEAPATSEKTAASEAPQPKAAEAKPVAPKEAEDPVEEEASAVAEVTLTEAELTALQESPYTAPHIKDGAFTPERTQLHDQIVNAALGDAEREDNPALYIVGGGPGSGAAGVAGNSELTGVPSDVPTVSDLSIKEQLPEVQLANERIDSGDPDEQDTNWSALSEAEASYISNRIQAAAADRGVSLITEGSVDPTAERVKAQVEAARAGGLGVQAVYVFVEPEEAIRRVQEEAGDEGVSIPEEQILATYAAIPPLFDQVKQGFFDRIQLFDNTPEAPHLIATGGLERFDILDTEAYERFMASAELAEDETERS